MCRLYCTDRRRCWSVNVTWPWSITCCLRFPRICRMKRSSAEQETFLFSFLRLNWLKKPPHTTGTDGVTLTVIQTFLCCILIHTRWRTVTRTCINAHFTTSYSLFPINSFSFPFPFFCSLSLSVSSHLPFSAWQPLHLRTLILRPLSSDQTQFCAAGAGKDRQHWKTQQSTRP